MKKILSLVLAALMVFSVVPAVFADEAVTTAVEESQYQEAIDFLKLIDLYKGDGVDDAAKEDVTRWQMALFVSRFITGKVDEKYWETTENDSGFSDVEDFEGASSEALGAISFASQKGIVNGIGGGLFDPETGVQYREAITMIVRSLGYTYKASGYPWSYINKAREIGLLDGITGIAYTEQIKREVVAQLLYNALFIEENGTTVAESIFNVGKTVVLITATNSVSYQDTEKVLRTNYVRFQELDAQGEPTGAAYHVSADKFDLDCATYEDDAAVGTPYFIYYVNGCADVIYAESLSTKYENRPGVKPVTVSGSYITIDGSKYQIVSLYNELNKIQGWNQDAAGTDQVKVYKSTGAVTYGPSKEYIVDSANRVWKLDAAEGYVLYAQYSSVMDCYYRLGEDGKWQLLQLDDILKTAGSTSGAFNKVTSVASKLLYSDFIVSDASMDGFADRVTYRQFAFGQISFSTISNKKNFSIAYATDSTTSVNALGNATANAVCADYRWTGVNHADITSGSYVIYYLDSANKEIEILEVIAGTKADDADDSYLVKGYLRGYDVAKDQIYLDADYTAYTLGYNELYQAPLKTRTTTSTANNNLQANIDLVQPKLNTYVELVVVDNKVVLIKGTSNTTDFVILDSFVGFEEDGIIANAYTTVTDELTQIKVGAYNGWTVGGFDYTWYVLSNMFQNASNAPVIPVELKKLYQVVYVKDGVYNLTDPAAPINADYDFLKINTYGYLEGTNGSALGAGLYTSTSVDDYWLILIEDTKEVIHYAGKLNPVVTLTDVAVYKVSGKDYVLVAPTKASIGESFNNFSGTTTQYMLFNTMVSGNTNETLFIQTAPYKWSVLMTDVYTGATSMIQIDPKLVPAGWNGYAGATAQAQLGLTNGSIYAVIDGTLMSTQTYTFENVAKFYAKANNATYGELSFVGGTMSAKETTGISTASIRDQLAEEVIKIFYKEWLNTDHSSLNDTVDNATIRMINTNAYKFLTSNLDTVNALTSDSSKEFTLYYIINADKSVYAWIDNSGEYAYVKVENPTVTAKKAGTVVNGTFTGGEAWEGVTVSSMSWREANATYDEYFYSTVKFSEEDLLVFDSLAAVRNATITVTVTFADGHVETYNKGKNGKVPDGICVNGDKTTQSFLIVNFAMDLDAHGYVAEYTVVVDKGAGQAVQIVVDNPNF